MKDTDVAVLFADKPVTMAVLLTILEPQYSYDTGHSGREREESAFQQFILYLQSLEGNNYCSCCTFFLQQNTLHCTIFLVKKHITCFIYFY